MLELNKIYHGDCLELMKDIPDKSIDMILCDLPYGTTRNKWDSIIPLEPLWEQYERIIKDRGMICLTASEPFASQLISSNYKLFKYDLIWDKKLPTGFLNAKRRPLRRHEQILCFYKKLPTYNPQMTNGEPYDKGIVKTFSSNYGKQTPVRAKNETGERYPTSILEFSNANQKDKLHPTQKPVELFEYLIKTYTNEGDVVLDNCIGSGTTAIACINTNRFFIGIEKEKEYVDIANRRIEEHKRRLQRNLTESL